MEEKHLAADVMEQSEEQEAVNKFLCTYIIPDAKIKQLEAWLKESRKKFPTMKHERLLRKAAEYFKLKKI